MEILKGVYGKAAPAYGDGLLLQVSPSSFATETAASLPITRTVHMRQAQAPVSDIPLISVSCALIKSSNQTVYATL
jgi:hypothetical protein